MRRLSSLAVALAAGLLLGALTGAPADAQPFPYGYDPDRRARGGWQMRRMERSFDRAQNQLNHALDRVAALRRLTFVGDDAFAGYRIDREVSLLARELDELGRQLDRLQRLSQRDLEDPRALRRLTNVQADVQNAEASVDQLRRQLARGFIQPRVFRSLVNDVERSLRPAAHRLARFGRLIGVEGERLERYRRY